MMPEGEDDRLGSGAERSVVHIVALADESCSLGDVPGYGSFGRAVVDHDKRAANHKVVGNLGKEGSWIK